MDDASWNNFCAKCAWSRLNGVWLWGSNMLRKDKLWPLPQRTSHRLIQANHGKSITFSIMQQISVECLLCAKHILNSKNTTMNKTDKVPAIVEFPFASNWLKIRYVTLLWAMKPEGKGAVNI